MLQTSCNRRSFLKSLGGAGALCCLVGPTALGGGRSAPSERITMATIGVGGMGTGDMQAFLHKKDQVQMVAVCDVDERHSSRAKNIVDKFYGNKDCRTYVDYRELLEQEELDAVAIATPDHWHALPAIAAARHGLDIHAQKPLARTIREGRAMCNAVKKAGVVWQTGSQQRSGNNFHRACELVRNGAIGEVQKVEVGLPYGGSGPHGGKSQGWSPEPIPDGLHYDFWLGSAPKAPYHNLRVHWDWRWILDYSGGQLTDWAGHHIDIAQWGMGRERTGPVEVWGEGKYPDDGLWNTPYSYKFHCKYREGAPMTVADNHQLDQGVRWHGEDGWIYVRRGVLKADPPGILNEKIGPDGVHLYDSPGHKQNFLNCIRTREETVAPIEIGHRSISVGLLGEIAMLTGRRIRWNPDTEQIIDDPEASRLLGRSYREPWHLPENDSIVT